MDIKVMSKSEAVKQSYTDLAGEKVIISIADLFAERAHFNRDNKSIKAVLYLSFEDVSEAGEGAMTAEDAAKIRDFVQRWQDKVSTVWVQCEMGVSRSAGIAAALMEYFGEDMTALFESETYCPNMLCYELTGEALKQKE